MRYKFSIQIAMGFLVATLISSIFGSKEFTDIYFIVFLALINISLIETIIDVIMKKKDVAEEGEA